MSTEAPVAPALTAGQRFTANLAAAPVETPAPEVPATPPPAETAVAAETPAGPVGETTAEITEPSFVEQANALGFENLTGEDAEERVLAYTVQMREKLAALEAEKVAWMAAAGRQEAPIAPAPTQEASKPWIPPTLDRDRVAIYREAKTDAAGKQVIGWKENTPVEIRQSVEQFENWQQNWAEALTTRPHEVLTDMVRQIAAEVASKQFTEQAQTQEVATFKQKVFADNPWIYEQDPLTKKPTQTLSAEGQRMHAWCQEAVDAGVTDPRRQWAYAERERKLAQFEAREKTTTTAQTVAQINAQKKQATVDASLAAKGLSAPVNNIPSPRSQARPLTAGQRFAQKLAAEGVST